MKTLVFLAALAVASSSTYAQTYEMPNKVGGSIVLTSRVGACQNGNRQAYATWPDGTVKFGCWYLLDNRVWVLYQTGDVRMYDPEDFVQKNNEKPYQRQSVPEKSTGM